MLEPFNPASIVRHNEVTLVTVSAEIEKHQRSVLCSFSTPDEYIHSSPLGLLIVSLGSSSLFCFAFRLKSLRRRSRPADDASFFFFSLKLISIWDFLYKSFFLIEDFLSSLSRQNQYLVTAGVEEPTAGSRQNYLYLLIRRSADWRLDSSSSGKTN